MFPSRIIVMCARNGRFFGNRTWYDFDFFTLLFYSINFGFDVEMNELFETLVPTINSY